MQSGELANLAGVSTDTLRHYERLGLLARPQRTESGYRRYTPQSLERVRLIRSALSVGFSLPELTAILKMRDIREAQRRPTYCRSTSRARIPLAARRFQRSRSSTWELPLLCSSSSATRDNSRICPMQPPRNCSKPSQGRIAMPVPSVYQRARLTFF